MTTLEEFEFKFSGVWASKLAVAFDEVFMESFMTEHTKPVKTPSNWDANGRSNGKQTGPVRPTPDACRPKK